VTGLELPMEDYFFAITFDTNIHPDYDQGIALEHQVNSSVRFTLYESLPAQLQLPEVELAMVNDNTVSMAELSGGNAWDVETRRHRLMWGFGNGGSGVLKENCSKPVKHLFIGVQCLKGFAFPAGTCTPNVMNRPTFDDCVSYCPFTLQVRAIPRLLRDGDAVPTLIGPGQWQAFELEVGEYDLVEVTIDRPEYDDVTFPDASWRDGFSGRAWLSKDSCINHAVIEEVEHHGYCPHGGSLAVDADTFQDIEPHRFCSRDRNYSFDVAFADSELAGGSAARFVRDAHVTPGVGELDDLGYSVQLQEISAEEALLEASMHYPTQLQIRARIAEKQRTATSLSKASADWRRRWPMRLCTSAAEAGRYFLTLWGDPAMDPTAHAGVFTIRVINERFDRSPLEDGIPRRGCLKRGLSESFMISSSALVPERTSLGLAEVTSYVVDAPSNHISMLMLRQGVAPTTNEYDAQVRYPQPPRVAMSACNVMEPQTWYLDLSLAPNEGPSEVFFTLTATLEDATRIVGDTVSGFTCCNQYKYYAFEGVDENIAPSVDFNVTSGRIKALYWRYDSCPVETSHVVNGECRGWCILDWYRLYSGNLGKPNYISSSTLTVPYGMGEEPDKRRGGRWYLGVQALDTPAEYSAVTAELAPPKIMDSGCSRLDRYCPTPDRYLNMGTSDAPRSGRRRLSASGLLDIAWHILPMLSTSLLLLLIPHGKMREPLLPQSLHRGIASRT